MIAYTCDPAKNVKCRKTRCWWNGGECKTTVSREYAMDSEQEKPLPWCCRKRCPHVGDGVSCDECRKDDV